MTLTRKELDAMKGVAVQAKADPKWGDAQLMFRMEFGPPTVLSLIERIEELEAVCTQAVKAQEHLKDLSGPVHRIACALKESP